MYKLSKQDVEVIEYLSKYRIMSIANTREIYNTNWYYRKRINKLIEEGYIKRYKYYYIELDRKGRKLLNNSGKEYIKNKANSSFMERLTQISDIGTLTINSNVKFIPSWNMKEKEVYTDTARKFQGCIIFNSNKYIVYYISRKKEKTFIHQVIYDIKKIIDFDNIIIFIDTFKNIETDINYFKFGKKHTYIILNSKENKEIIKHYNNIEIYELIKNIYGESSEVLVSDWKLADFLIDNFYYVCNMIFIDTERLGEIKWFFEENEKIKRKIDVITLEENKEIIKKLVPQNVKIVTLKKENLLIEVLNEKN